MAKRAAVVAAAGHAYHHRTRCGGTVMPDIAELDNAPDTIEASLNYLADTGEKLVTQVAEPGGRDSRSGGSTEAHRVIIHNGRPLPHPFHFDPQAFRLVVHAPKTGHVASHGT